MTMAAAIESRTADAQAWSKSSRIAHVDLLADLDQAEPIWRGFENQQHLFTPYQRFDFLRPWQQNVGASKGLHPLIAIAYDQAHVPLLLLPLALDKKYGIRIARFMGGKHTTFNMGLWNRDFVEQAGRADLDELLTTIRERSAADVLAFTQQPFTWQDLPNPMTLLAHQPSANDCPLMTMAQETPATTQISSSLRRRLRTKERKLEGLPGYRYYLAARDEDIKRLLDAFFRIKPQRMAEQKLPNVFAEPGVEDFIRDACMARLPGGKPAIEMHALECDDEIIAVFAGVADDHRFSMMFNTYTISENSRHSPGLILIHHIVDFYAERGYRALDLGIGSDGYKKLFCKGDEAIFDCYVPLSPRGTWVAAAMSVTNRAKHLVKHNSTLLSLAHRFQHAIR